jgi:hypothetical protein
MGSSAKVKNKKQIDRINALLYGDEGRYAYLFPNRDDVPVITNHPFQDIVHDKQKADEFVIRAILDPEYIGWTVKSILNTSLFPMQLAILKTLWDHSFPMLIASRGSGKSFILAVYAILKAILEPGSKIVIVGAGLRQAKLVFQYIEDIWSSAPVLRSIVGGGRKAGPKQSVDLCYFRIGESVIIAAPMGDGTKIRGLRAHCIIADEFASIPADVFDIVVRGFAATSKSPVEEAQKIALDKKLAKAGVPKHVRDRLVGDTRGTNQIIYSGTAYYAFNHFAKRYEMWKSIIQSGGNRDIIADIFGGEDNIPEHFNWKDYAVIRLPHNCVQEGLLDQRQLAHAKATLPTNIYLMEYGACAVENTQVYTSNGTKRIVDVNCGDLVISHTGLQRKVIRRKYRYYTGSIYKISTDVDNPIEVTAYHPIWNGRKFVSAKHLMVGDKLSSFVCNDGDSSPVQNIVYVIKIEVYDYSGWVYNLEVEEDHSYLAQGIVHHNCFVADSDGIYKRSLIEACTTYPGKPITTPDGDIVFTPITRAQKGVKYVIGIDPAAERDNLAITIIEVWPNHWRIVYCWAVNKPEFEKRKKRGLVTNKDYYDYCCSRIRDVVKAFSPIRIEMDSQGGGYAIAEMLRNKKLLDPSKGDMPIYEVIDFDAPKAMDEERDGPHILHLIAQSTEWNSQSNLFMHKSFETRKLLFPGINTVKMQAAMAVENLAGITTDTYEDIVHNIEELKNELCAIKMTSTPTGKEKFEAPSVTEMSISEGKKKTHKMRKDRYTSLLIAHRYVYDNDITPPPIIDYDDVPGNIRAVNVDPSEGMYRGPGIAGFRNAEWARSNNVAAVKRGEVYNQ